MVNGFFGLGLLKMTQKEEAITVLEAINQANAVDDFSFYENFNSQTKSPNGVPYCTWSAAATVMLHQSVYGGFKYLV